MPRQKNTYYIPLLYIIITIISVVVINISFKENHDNENYKTIVIYEQKRNYQLFEMNEKIKDIMRTEDGINKTIAFFNSYTNSSEISLSITEESLENNIPITIAFALAWGESRFNNLSINFDDNSNGSKDYGLFQLNSFTFPEYTEEELFDIRKNASLAMQHLKMCLKYYENDIVTSIAAYNAGIEGVKAGINFITLRHINNIIKYNEMLFLKLNDFIGNY